MKNLFCFILIISLLCSCGQVESELMPVRSTIPILATDTRDSILIKAAHVVPTPNQYAALKNEFIAFIHFGPNAFTRMEWGSGKEDPAIFNLQNLDTDQWCEAMKAAGMKMVIITAKHHDGFCLWQSRYTTHSVASTPFKNGEGDILKELSESCKTHGLKLGVYLSPADLYQIESPTGLYGNLSTYSKRTIPRPIEGRPFANKTTFTFEVDDYNEYFLNQLFELLTEYGPIDEVWFDGAHPKRKGGQKYNYLAWRELIEKLAPQAVVFGKQDIRWCGNEAGKTRKTEWNVIPYQDDPAKMNRFADLMAINLGHREQLYEGKYLHYQQAETNTSIREGWFYRDDTDQKTRNADDVFDIYERAVGGNSTFLLNIPPNREGRFSPIDVAVLKEVGQRISRTYAQNLLKGASGPAALLDDDESNFERLTQQTATIELKTPKPITINRFVIQEAIRTHSERIEKHALDAWLDNAWQEIASGTNVGYKRILRFPEVTSNKFRLRILEARLPPALASLAAHYYPPHPPQLSMQRSPKGLVSIQARKHLFGWKPHGEASVKNINSGMEIRYTLDGQSPNKQSTLFEQAFFVEQGEVQARAFYKEKAGSVSTSLFGVVKKDWQLIAIDSEAEKHAGAFAFDENPATYWRSKAGAKAPYYLAVDLGEKQSLKGFAYTPPMENGVGLMERGRVQISEDGRSWETLVAFEFGNLKNDRTSRRLYFEKPVMTRYVLIESKGGEQTAIAEIDFL